MCGLYGIIAKDGNIENELLLALHNQATSWGHDAWGYIAGWKQGRNTDVEIDKGIGHIPNLIPELGYANFVLGHTRAATQGNPRNNDNNHPVVSSDKTTYVTHNGMINEKRYYDYIRSKWDPDYVPYCEVDTLALPEMISGFVNDGADLTTAVSLLFNMMEDQIRTDSAAIATVHNSNNNKIVLAATSAPLNIWVYDNQIVYASVSRWIEGGIHHSGSYLKKIVPNEMISLRYGEIFSIDSDTLEYHIIRKQNDN